MTDGTKIISCPNCDGKAVKEGNKIICDTCDATFTLTRTGAAKVADVGRFQTIEDRLDKIESTYVAGRVPDPDPEPEPIQQPENDDDLLG